MIKDIEIKKLSVEEINQVLENFFINSGFIVKNKNIDVLPFRYKIEDISKKISLHVICKNMGNSGWADRPDIIRIQIKNLSDVFVYTTKNEATLLSGLCSYKGKTFLVVWNAYRYMNHKTNRSCYANVAMLDKVYDLGYFFSRDFSQEIWLCDEKHFNILIRDYLLFTYNGD